jgi:hypothetical protein
MTKKSTPKKQDPAKLDGLDYRVAGFDGGIALLERQAKVDGQPRTVTVRATAGELRWAPEGFWFLPQRVGPHVELPRPIREAMMLHPLWAEGRDDLALKALRGLMGG